MKKLRLSIATLTSVVYLAGCSAAGTQVRLLELSYSLPGAQTEAARLNVKNLPTKKNADSSEYIFPGDILTFTVELEDPNFEFISLLAIKFNGVTIRANTNDSIVTTSDCGANICVNFPFEVSADVTEYTVEEVKFAKLSSESGINAIIDNQSQNSLTLDIYTDEVFPFVDDTVDLLNETFDSYTFYNIQNNNSSFQISSGSGKRIIQFVNLTPNKVFRKTDVNLPTFNFFGPQDGSGNGQGFIFSNLNAGTSSGLIVTGPIMYIYVYNEIYKDSYFYAENNSVYVNLFGESKFLFEMHERMSIKVFNG
jgi:hypothetical protein